VVRARKGRRDTGQGWLGWGETSSGCGGESRCPFRAGPAITDAVITDTDVVIADAVVTDGRGRFHQHTALAKRGRELYHDRIRVVALSSDTRTERG
jgi:hypothetical protein